ncbi:hypothetical protein FGB62_69g10 [Gracilaria domingensis]|nr:hypothetical protein FGB62_69g10 [Gracilaria domingensis]
MYTTTAVASVLIYRHAKKGNVVRIETLKFPYWTGDLLHRQWSHVLLLVLRAALIGIPVYLETGLEARRGVVSSSFQHAFIVAPKDNWVPYERNLNVSIHKLISQSELVYDRCTRIDVEGWRSASMANVSFLENGHQRVECISNTKKKVFRSVRNKDALRNFSKFQNDVLLNLSWLEGPVEEFENDAFSLDEHTRLVSFRNYTGVRYRITNIELASENDLECFPTIFLELYMVLEFAGPGPEITHSFLCQRVTGTTIEYFFGLLESSTLNVTSEERRNVMTNKNRSLTVTMGYIETLEFEKDMMITAAQIANSEQHSSDWRAVGCRSCTSSQAASVRKYFYWLVGSLLYARIDNATLEVNSLPFNITIISAKLLIISVLEVGVVLLFGVGIYFWLRRYDLQMTNTLNGLSEVWATSSYSAKYMGLH